MLLHEVHDSVGVLHIHLRSSNRRPYPFSSRFRIILVLACCLLYAQAVLSGLLIYISTTVSGTEQIWNSEIFIG